MMRINMEKLNVLCLHKSKKIFLLKKYLYSFYLLIIYYILKLIEYIFLFISQMNLIKIKTIITKNY